MTIADNVLDAVAGRLATVTIANGYRTDAGINTIYRGLERVDDEHPAPVFSIFMADETLARDRANVHNRDIKASILIAGWCRPADEDSVQPLLDLLADIKKAVFQYGNAPSITALVMDHYYEGASFMPRQDGGTFAQIVVEGVFKWRETV